MTTTTLRILVVCTGNIHRSPLTQALLRTWADWYLDDELASRIEIASAGTAALVGAPMSEEAATIARALKADGSRHRATALTEATIAAADLILTAEVCHRDRVVSLVPRALQRTFTVREAGRAAAQMLGADDGLAEPRSRDDIAARAGRLALFRSRGDDDIIDPQGLPPEAALQMTAELVPASAVLARLLLGMPSHAVDAYAKATTDTGMLSALIAGAEQRGAQ